MIFKHSHVVLPGKRADCVYHRRKKQINREKRRKHNQYVCEMGFCFIYFVRWASCIFSDAVFLSRIQHWIYFILGVSSVCTIKWANRHSVLINKHLMRFSLFPAPSHSMYICRHRLIHSLRCCALFCLSRIQFDHHHRDVELPVNRIEREKKQRRKNTEQKETKKRLHSRRASYVVYFTASKTFWLKFLTTVNHWRTKPTQIEKRDSFADTQFRTYSFINVVSRTRLTT